MHIVVRGLLSVGAFLGSAQPVAAQGRRPLTFPPAFVIDQWTTREGMPQNSVNAVARAPDGSLWIGTEDGLLRFKDRRYEIVPVAADAPPGPISVLFIDHGGVLWVVTPGGALLRRAGDHFETTTEVEGVKLGPITAIAEDVRSTIWVNAGEP